MMHEMDNSLCAHAQLLHQNEKG